MSDEPEPGNLGEQILGFLRDLVGEEQVEALMEAVQQGDDDPFDAMRDTVTSALGELSGVLDELGSSFSGVLSDASEQLSGIAAAIAGAGSVDDAIERVKTQLGADADADDGPKDWADLGIKLDDDGDEPA